MTPVRIIPSKLNGPIKIQLIGDFLIETAVVNEVSLYYLTRYSNGSLGFRSLIFESPAVRTSKKQSVINWRLFLNVVISLPCKSNSALEKSLNLLVSSLKAASSYLPTSCLLWAKFTAARFVFAMLLLLNCP